MTNQRLPLNSEEWDASPAMSKAKSLLLAILQSEKPSPKDVEDFIYELEGCDCYERAYYFALPYLTDYILEHKESFLEVVSDFCNPLMTANGIPNDCKAQIRLVREQIVSLMLYALESNSSETDFSYNGSCHIYVAGIAAVYMEAHVARQIAMLE